jgi:predicted LPLAT superfamily acyltransferase
MQESLIAPIKCIEDNLETKNPHLNIINLSKGGVYVTMKIATALLNNEIVAMMADRATEAKNRECVTFFGKNAAFNKNPFSIAYKTEKPLMGIAFSYQKPQHYRIEFIEITMNKNNHAEEEIHKAMQTYADFFASHVRAYPNQWFNLYPFWKEEVPL